MLQISSTAQAVTFIIKTFPFLQIFITKDATSHCHTTTCNNNSSFLVSQRH